MNKSDKPIIMSKADKITLRTRYSKIVTLTYDDSEKAWTMDCSDVAYTSVLWSNVNCDTIHSIDPEGLFPIGVGSILTHSEIGQQIVNKVEPIAGTGNYKLFVI